MKNVMFIWILFLGVTFAQGDIDTNAEQKPPATITYFVQPTTRVSDNIMFLFDCSRSMGKTNRFYTALAQVNTILRQPLDDGMFSMIVFKSTHGEMDIWPGIKEKDSKPSPYGWAKLPSMLAVNSANDFLNSIECDGWTDIGSVLEKAFNLNVDREEVTIILFSDGNNTYPLYSGKRPSQVAKRIKALQKDRTDRKKDKIKIFCFGVSAEQNILMLSAIAKAGGGGYLTTDMVCSQCRKNKKDICEVQQIHRSEHLSKDDDNYEEKDEDKNLDFQNYLRNNFRFR